MRTLGSKYASVALLLGAFLLPSSAIAQLPFPDLAPRTPDVRIASGDTLKNQVQAAIQRSERAVTVRKPEIEAEQKTLQTRLEADAEILGDDLDTLRKLDAALAREASLIDETAEVLTRAMERLEQKPDEQRRAATLDEIIHVELNARRMLDEARAASRVANRLGALAPTLPDLKAATSQERLQTEQSRVQIADVDLAHARALEAWTRHRLARIRASGIRLPLVTPAQVEASEVELQNVMGQISTLHKSLEVERQKLASQRPPSEADEEVQSAHGALNLARLDQLSRREDALEAREIRAKMAFAAESWLASGEGERPAPEASASRIASLVAEVHGHQRRIEGEIGRVRDAEQKSAGNPKLKELLGRRRLVLDESLGFTLEAQRDLESVQIIQDKVFAPQQRRPGFFLNALLTFAVVLATVILLTYGLKYVRGLISEGGRLAKIVRLDPKQLGRVTTMITLLWPLLVFMVSATVIIWQIWDLDVTIFEALKVIDRPIFFVEGQGISLFSIAELFFAIWAAVVLSRTLREFLSKSVYKKLDWDIGLTNAMSTLVHYLIVFIGVAVGLQFVGIGLSSFALLAGVLGIGIGFGLRNILENFFSGLIILAERPIKIGDFVEIGNSLEGEVKQIRARSTTLVTRDNISVIIPNSEFVGMRVTNWSHGDNKVRLAVPVGVVYGSDTDLVRKILLEVGNRHGQVLKKPAPEVQFREFGASSLDFALMVWIDEQLHRFRIASDLHFAIDKAFRKVGIVIAFPQMDLHLKSISDEARKALTANLESEGAEEEETEAKSELPLDVSKRRPGQS